MNPETFALPAEPPERLLITVTGPLILTVYRPGMHSQRVIVDAATALGKASNSFAPIKGATP